MKLIEHFAGKILATVVRVILAANEGDGGLALSVSGVCCWKFVVKTQLFCKFQCGVLLVAVHGQSSLWRENAMI
ncbi:MAG: hypothetical protein V4719_10850 [Planctomycetota bacterium]